MLCENCGKREANVRYSENINGVKKQLNLCEECSKKLGIGEINFSIPMDINDFFSDFFEELQQPEFKSLIGNVSEEICPTCGKNFEEILNTGRFGCGNCYNTFEDRIVQHSFNLKELINENDIVEYRINSLSELKVGRVKKYRDARSNKQYMGIEGFDITKIYILSVLIATKYKQECYVVEDEKDE